VVGCLLGEFLVPQVVEQACPVVAREIFPLVSPGEVATCLLAVTSPVLPQVALAAASPEVVRCPREAEPVVFREAERVAFPEGAWAGCPVVAFPVVAFPVEVWREVLDLVARFPVRPLVLACPGAPRSPVVAFRVVAFRVEASPAGACPVGVFPVVGLEGSPGAAFLGEVREVVAWC
jgi:hypothetical protein